MVVGLSQAVQVPIALCATIGTLAFGHLDLTLGGLLSAGVIGGSATGARIAHKLPRPMLTRIVGLVLLVVGGLLIVRNRHLLLGSLVSFASLGLDALLAGTGIAREFGDISGEACPAD